MRQKCILLRAVEAMHFVDEHNRPLPVVARALRLRHHFFDFLDSGKHCAEGNEFATRALGNNSRQRRFSASRRPPQQHRAQVVALDLRPQRFSGTQQIFLADEFVESLRAHPIRERTPGLRLLLRLECPK